MRYGFSFKTLAQKPWSKPTNSSSEVYLSVYICVFIQTYIFVSKQLLSISWLSIEYIQLPSYFIVN